MIAFRRVSGLAVALIFCGYFAASAFSGENSLSQVKDLKAKEQRLLTVKRQVELERAELDARVTDMSSKNLDADRLEEEVRKALGYVHPDEIVIFLEKSK